MRQLPTNNIIVTCAVTGSLHTPSMSPSLPVTPEEIADACIEASQAGASIVHIHTRDPETGEPTTNIDDFKEIAQTVTEETNVIIQPTTGGSPTMTPEERIEPVTELQPEMSSCNMGSFNLALYPLLERVENWKNDWEKEYLESTSDLVFKNTFDDMRVMLTEMEKRSTVPCLECWDVGHLYNLKHCLDKGWVSPPVHIEFALGAHGGIGTHPENLTHMKSISDKLFGDDYSFSVIGVGSAQYPLITLGASMGGNIRVGMEENIDIEPNRLAKSNAELVNKAVRLVDSIHDRNVASPSEVREFFSLKGSESTEF